MVEIGKKYRVKSDESWHGFEIGCEVLIVENTGTESWEAVGPCGRQRAIGSEELGIPNTRIRLANDAPVPTYATDGSAGFDIASNETITINPGHWVRISTGIHIQLPPDQELQIRSRSGIAYRKGLVVHQGIGTIDSDYRGEVQVMIRNTGMNAVTVNRGDRIAQGVIAPVIRIEFEVVDKLDDTVRGEAGFGSSGV